MNNSGDFTSINKTNRKPLPLPQKGDWRKKTVGSEQNQSMGAQEIDKKASKASASQGMAAINIQNSQNDDSDSKLDALIREFENFNDKSDDDKKKFCSNFKNFNNECKINKWTTINKFLDFTSTILTKCNKEYLPFERYNIFGLIQAGMDNITDNPMYDNINSVSKEDMDKFFEKLLSIYNLPNNVNGRFFIFSNFLNTFDAKSEKNSTIKNNELFKNFNLQFRKDFMSFLLNQLWTPYNIIENDVYNEVLNRLPFEEGRDKDIQKLEFIYKSISEEKYINQAYRQFVNNFIIQINDNIKKDGITPDSPKYTKIESLHNSILEIISLNDIKQCLISNQYLMMTKMLYVEDLSKYSDLELNIIKGMDADNIVESKNPQIEAQTREAILKEVFGEDFYNAHKDEIQKMSDEDKKKELSSIQNYINLEMLSNGCYRKIKNLQELFTMFDNVYSNIMSNLGIDNPEKKRAIELCFAKNPGLFGLCNPNDNIVSIMSLNPSWTYLEYIVNNDDKTTKNQFQSIMVHELTHYTQHLLMYSSYNELELSEQGRELKELCKQKYYLSENSNDNDEELSYYLHPREMGARAIQILTELEKICNVEYGTFCFQEKGTDEARKAQARKIVNTLEQYIIKNQGKSLAEFLNADFGSNKPKFCNLISLFSFNDGDIESMVKYDKKLHLTQEQLSGPDANEHIEKCFEHLLIFIIPRSDMKLITQDLKSNEQAFIQSEALVANDTRIQEQIDKCEELSQIYTNLLGSMRIQADGIMWPSLETISKQISILEADNDVIKYNSNKNVIKMIKDYDETSKKLLEENPKVAEYLYLKKIEIAQQISQCIAFEKINLLNKIINENDQFLSNIPEFADNYKNIKKAIENYNKGDAKEQKKSLKTLKKYSLATLYKKGNLKTDLDNKKECNTSLKSTLQDLQSQKDQILYNQFNYERVRNNYDQDTSMYKVILTEKFTQFWQKFNELPEFYQSRLKVYSDWTKSGYEKFSNWIKALTR